MVIEEKQHIGKKIERIRILKGIKQEVLASELGLSQSAVSRLEQSESVDREKLVRIADILGVTPEMIENFNEETAVNIFANNYNGSDNSAAVNFQCHFNPFDKIVELYERMLETERNKVTLLEELVKSQQKDGKG